MSEGEVKKFKSLRNLFVTLDGQDPEAQQMINDFMRLDSPIERTNLATKSDVHFISWLEYVGQSFFPNRESDPFRDLSKMNAIANMARGGMKSQQVVDLLRNQPDLSALTQATQQTQEKKSFFDRFRGSPKE